MSTVKEFVEQLQKNDEALNKARAERDAIKRAVLEQGGQVFFNEVYEALMADHEPHWSI